MTRHLRLITGEDTKAELIGKGKAIVESGKHAPPRGKLLGHLYGGLVAVHENDPQACIDALMAERSRHGTD